MTLRFRNLKIPGTHETIRPSPPSLKVRRDRVWGQHGEIEVYGGQEGRVINVIHTLHNNYSSERALERALLKLLNLTGTNGILKETGIVTRTFRFCTFEGYNEIRGPLEDIAGTLDSGWWIDLQLNFYQLKALGDVKVEEK